MKKTIFIITILLLMTTNLVVAVQPTRVILKDNNLWEVKTAGVITVNGQEVDKFYFDNSFMCSYKIDNITRYCMITDPSWMWDEIILYDYSGAWLVDINYLQMLIFEYQLKHDLLTQMSEVVVQ